QQPVRLLLDGDREGVRSIEELAQPDRVTDRFVVGQRALAQALVERRTLDQFHRDVEVVAVGAEVEDLGHHAVTAREFLLQHPPVPLRGNRAGAVLPVVKDQLQRRGTAVAAAPRTKHRAELAAANRLRIDDLEILACHPRLPSATRLPDNSSPPRAALTPSTL